MFLDRRKLALALTEIDTISQKLPETAVADLAQEVVRRVANNLRPSLPAEFTPSDAEIDALCEALLDRDHATAVSMIEASQRSGASYDMLCQSYLAVASQRLGEWWNEDRVSFYQVTLAAGRIYAILRILRLQKHLPAPDLNRSAIFANVPGDDHTLGITIAADMIRDRGWDIELFVGRSHDELVSVLMRRDPPLIGLSATTLRALPALSKLVVALRLTNPGTKILVCGGITSLNLNLVGVAGVDASAPDFDAALAYMERIASAG